MIKNYSASRATFYECTDQRLGTIGFISKHVTDARCALSGNRFTQQPPDISRHYRTAGPVNTHKPSTRAVYVNNFLARSNGSYNSNRVGYLYKSEHLRGVYYIVVCLSNNNNMCSETTEKYKSCTYSLTRGCGVAHLGILTRVQYYVYTMHNTKRS